MMKTTDIIYINRQISCAAV